MGVAVEHDHNGDESKTIIPCLEGWISILPCRFNYWITSSAPLLGKNQGLSFISMQFHSSKSRISSSAPSLYFSHVSDCWKLVHEWTVSLDGRSSMNLEILQSCPPPPTQKKTQIIHRYYQVIVKSTSACAKVLIEHGSMTKKCKEHALWGPQQLGSRQIPLFWWGKGGHGSGCSSCPPLSKHTS